MTLLVSRITLLYTRAVSSRSCWSKRFYKHVASGDTTVPDSPIKCAWNGVCVSMFVCLSVHVHVCVYVSVYMCMVCVCVFMFTHSSVCKSCFSESLTIFYPVCAFRIHIKYQFNNISFPCNRVEHFVGFSALPQIRIIW